MNGLDTSIIISWLSWIGYNISHRNAWGINNEK